MNEMRKVRKCRQRPNFSIQINGFGCLLCGFSLRFDCDEANALNEFYDANGLRICSIYEQE